MSKFFPLPSIENTNQLLSNVPSIDGALPNLDQHTQSSTGFIPINDGLGQHQPHTDRQHQPQTDRQHQLPAATNLASNPNNNILRQHHSQTDQYIHL